MEGNNVFLVGNSTTPYLRPELHEIDSKCATWHLPEECDLLIIGAGLSGVATANYLLDRNSSPPFIAILGA
jgi:hypothetical protein